MTTPNPTTQLDVAILRHARDTLQKENDALRREIEDLRILVSLLEGKCQRQRKEIGKLRGFRLALVE